MIDRLEKSGGSFGCGRSRHGFLPTDSSSGKQNKTDGITRKLIQLSDRRATNDRPRCRLYTGRFYNLGTTLNTDEFKAQGKTRGRTLMILEFALVLASRIPLWSRIWSCGLEGFVRPGELCEVSRWCQKVRRIDRVRVEATWVNVK